MISTTVSNGTHARKTPTSQQQNGNGHASSLPLGRDDAEDPLLGGVDSEFEDKYSRKKKRRRKPPPGVGSVVRGSTQLGVCMLFAFVLLIWHRFGYHRESAMARKFNVQRERAAAVLKERMKHMPHFKEEDSQDESEDDGENSEDDSEDEEAEEQEARQQQSATRRRQQLVDKRVLKKWKKEHKKAGGGGDGPPPARKLSDRALKSWLEQLDKDIVNNIKGGIRWIRPNLLPPIPGGPEKEVLGGRRPGDRKTEFFRSWRMGEKPMAWEDEWREMEKSGKSNVGPIVDYADRQKYVFPDISKVKESGKPPPPKEYPPLAPLKDLMMNWPQDEDFEGMIHERLMLFNFSDPEELKLARAFRDAEVPFKLCGIPELESASQKWTDDYVSRHFDADTDDPRRDDVPKATGTAQESPNNYFAFFTGKNWDITTMGIPPTRNSDWTFAKWSQHARYADAVRLDFERPHFYWQSGVDSAERYLDKSQWSFISRDLPSFSSPTQTFFVFHPDEQKGIQCRFGERGVVAATHYDGGRNFVGMVTGAKRYVLSPPRECSKLGIFNERRSPVYRHSLLNFAHIQYLYNENKAEEAKGMSPEERGWLERAGEADSVETVLKAGEALYIPSHWFHYIISVQKSAQCNVRSGIDYDGTPEFGNRATVEQCM